MSRMLLVIMCPTAWWVVLCPFVRAKGGVQELMTREKKMVCIRNRTLEAKVSASICRASSFTKRWLTWAFLVASQLSSLHLIMGIIIIIDLAFSTSRRNNIFSSTPLIASVYYYVLVKGIETRLLFSNHMFKWNLNAKQILLHLLSYFILISS